MTELNTLLQSPPAVQEGTRLVTREKYHAK